MNLNLGSKVTRVSLPQATTAQIGSQGPTQAGLGVPDAIDFAKTVYHAFNGHPTEVEAILSGYLVKRVVKALLPPAPPLMAPQAPVAVPPGRTGGLAGRLRDARGRLLPIPQARPLPALTGLQKVGKVAGTLGRGSLPAVTGTVVYGLVKVGINKARGVKPWSGEPRDDQERTEISLAAALGQHAGKATDC